MNFKELIQIEEGAARIAFTYAGTPDRGMLAWLDSEEMKHWWKADSAVIEPFEGGMFYLTWHEAGLDTQHAIYGVVKRVDFEQNEIEVGNIMYVFSGGKMGHIRLYVKFEPVAPNETKFTLTHRHDYKGQQLHLYNAAVWAAWPKTFSLLKTYLERREPCGLAANER